MREKIAKQIVQAIENDFTDRRGLRQEWEQFDDEIKEEIREEWKRLIIHYLKAEGFLHKSDPSDFIAGEHEITVGELLEILDIAIGVCGERIRRKE